MTWQHFSSPAETFCWIFQLIFCKSFWFHMDIVGPKICAQISKIVDVISGGSRISQKGEHQPEKGANLLFGQNFLKTVWKYRKLDREGGASKILLGRSVTGYDVYELLEFYSCSCLWNFLCQLKKRGTLFLLWVVGVSCEMYWSENWLFTSIECLGVVWCWQS